MITYSEFKKVQGSLCFSRIVRSDDSSQYASWVKLGLVEYRKDSWHTTIGLTKNAQDIHTAEEFNDYLKK